MCAQCCQFIPNAPMLRLRHERPQLPGRERLEEFFLALVVVAAADLLARESAARAGRPRRSDGTTR